MATPRVDWHAVLSDIAYLGVTGDALAKRIGVPTAQLQRLATGRQLPKPRAASALAMLWVSLTGKRIEYLPRATDPPAAPRAEVPNLESNEEQDAPYVLLEQLSHEWAAMTRRERD